MDVDGLKGLGKFCPSENVNGTDSFKATSVELSTLIKTVSRQYSMDETDKEEKAISIGTSRFPDCDEENLTAILLLNFC